VDGLVVAARPEEVGASFGGGGVNPTELGGLGWAHRAEVPRPEEHDLPPGV